MIHRTQLNKQQAATGQAGASKRSFGALAGLFEELSPADNVALRKTLQLYLDSGSASKSDREKQNELEAILISQTKGKR